MVNTDILSLYYGGVIAFRKETRVGDDQTHFFPVGHEMHITPGVLHMVGSGKIPKENFYLKLRKMIQIEDSELVELSRIAAPPEIFGNSLRFVTIQGVGETATKEIHLTATSEKNKERDYSLVINAKFEMAITEVIHGIYGAPPIISQLAIRSQHEVFKWLLNKHFDIFQLIPKNLASGRKKWTSEGYEGPKSFKK